MHKYLILASACLAANLVYAHDLGVQSRVYPIDEPDMREVIAGQVSEVDWAAQNRELEKKADDWGEHLTSYDLPKALRTETAWVDPSVVLTQDINMPVEQADGSWKWQLIYPSGTRVNPLEATRPITNMLFFDGRDAEQVELALGAIKAHPYRLMLVLTAGNPDKLSKQIQLPVYYANPKMLERFEIKKTPSLLGVGEGERRLYLAVTTFTTPYDLKLIDKAWHGLPETINVTER